MPIVDDILETLGQAARRISTGQTSEGVVESYDVVASLIEDILRGEGSEAIRVVVNRNQDPEIWAEPVLGVALGTLDATRISEIHAATYVLASRLPGKTKIPRPKRKSAQDTIRLTGRTKVGRRKRSQTVEDVFAETSSGGGERESA
jgi:hypothetical protein